LVQYASLLHPTRLIHGPDFWLPPANPDEIVRAVNEVGAAPGDRVAILEVLKEAGALQAELIVI